MHSKYRRVIKSEEIKLVGVGVSQTYGKDAANKHARTSSVDGTSLDLDNVKKTFAKEIAHTEAQAFQKGFTEGFQKGKEQQKSDTGQTIQMLTSLIEELNELKQKILENAEEQILDLTLAVARKVIHMEVATRREIIQGVLKDAIRIIVDRENMKIHVHPQDFQYMMEIKSDFLSSFDGVKNSVFEEDETVGRGGAIVETQFGEVDARIDQQFNEVKSLLLSSAKHTSTVS
ncbi:MAG: hypothetical protein JXA41_07685 [Deltaproteobacteria bacterium]|nr:hypothetical protein [Deltaproteobacteria bacterium]